MTLTSLTVKKGRIERVTTKTPAGGYDSNENSAEVTMTFDGEGSPIDEKACNERVAKAVKHLLYGDKEDDPDWLKDDNYLKKEPMQKAPMQQEIK